MHYRLITIVLVAAFGVAHAAERPDTGPFPGVGAYEVLRCDFHIHTPHSDGDLTPVERVEEAAKWGYDVIAITDHGNFIAYEEALPLANEMGMVLIRGIETGLDGREHIVALDFDPDYEPVNSHKWALEEGKETVFYKTQMPKIAKDAGGYLIYAHPHVGLEEPMLWGIGEGFIRGIEVKNGVVGNRWETIESHGTWFYPNAMDWAIEHNLTIFANSDVHNRRARRNSPVTLVMAANRSPEAVMDALKAGRTLAWFDEMIWGKQDMLAAAMESFVTVSVEDGKVNIVNNTPAALTAVVGGNTVELEPNSDASADADGDEVEIRWTNLWVSSTNNLITKH